MVELLTCNLMPGVQRVSEGCTHVLHLDDAERRPFVASLGTGCWRPKAEGAAPKQGCGKRERDGRYATNVKRFVVWVERHTALAPPALPRCARSANLAVEGAIVSLKHAEALFLHFGTSYISCAIHGWRNSGRRCVLLNPRWGVPS